MIWLDKLDHMDSPKNTTAEWIALGSSKAHQKKLLKSRSTILMFNLTTFGLAACKYLVQNSAYLSIQAKPPIPEIICVRNVRAFLVCGLLIK